MAQLGCDRCDWTVTTRGPERAADGATVAHLYCERCGVVRRCVLDAAPPRVPLGVPLGPRHGQPSRLARGLARRIAGADRQLAAAYCPICAGRDLILTPIESRMLPCPQCCAGEIRAVTTTD